MPHLLLHLLLRLLKLQKQRLALEQTIAEEELAIAIKRVNINLKEQKSAVVINQENAKKLEFLKDFETADNIQEENVERLVEAVKVWQGVEGESITENFEAAKQ